MRLASYKIAYYDEERNKEEIRLHLDMLDEVRAKTEQWLAHYQDLMAKHYNTKVKTQHFSIRDLILRKVTTATKDLTPGKLGPNWEGSYRVIDYYRRGTYNLETLDRQRLHHLCNVEHLKRYY